MGVLSWSSAATIINGVDAYRAWGQGFHDAFLAAGLVQTTDTGQVDWPTAALGSQTLQNTPWGYELYRFNDPQQAVFPLFLKVEYGRGSSNTATIDCPAIWITVGRSSNGAGVLGGVLLARQYLVGSASATYGGPTPYPCFATGDGSGIVMVLYPSAVSPGSNLTSYLQIERSRDASGAATAEGVVIAATGYTVKNFWLFGANAVVGQTQTVSLTALGYIPAVINGTVMSGTAPNTMGTSKDASAVNLVAMPFACPGVTPWNSKLAMIAHPGDLVYVTLLDLTRYGQPHRYRVFANQQNSGPQPISALPGAYTTWPAILWDA